MSYARNLNEDAGCQIENAGLRDAGRVGFRMGEHGFQSGGGWMS